MDILHEHEHEFDNIVYLDNGATVFPKPDEILEGALEIYRRFGVNPGRAGYDLCMVGGSLIEETRHQMTSFFGGSAAERLCFAANASDGLNLLIQGMARPGDHVVSTVLEHNSVLRPLNHLQREGRITRDYVPCDAEGYIDPQEIARHLRDNTRMVVVNHGSNVIGTVQPLAEIGKLCQERGVYLVVDVSQTAGVIAIDVQAMGISALAFTGHKSLLAPGGVGGVYVSEGVQVESTRFGGTGVRSAYPYQLEEYPWRLEVGTPNLFGIAGLHMAQKYIQRRGLEQIYHHEMALFSRLQDAVLGIEGITLHGTRKLEERLPVLSFTVDGFDPSDVSTMLDVDYGIATRSGLHCAPLIHEHLGTAPRGAVRMSVGPMSKDREIDLAIEALQSISQLAAHR